MRSSGMTARSERKLLSRRGGGMADRDCEKEGAFLRLDGAMLLENCSS